jgi:hypothetical protein
MKKFTLIALFIVIQMLVAAGISFSGDDGWGPGSAYNSKFDPETVETLRGELVKMDLFMPKGMSMGVQILLKTGEGTVPVHLGPVWYMKKQKREIAPGDKIEITGSRFESEGKPAIMASEVKKGDKKLQLRDENGVPVWSGEKK